MTIASALDKLNDKLAGSDQPAAQTIESMILRIIDNIDAGGGGSIPVASADTLGGIKVGNNLSITDGGVLSASGGGGGGLVVHDVEGTLDKTYAEIAAAAEIGVVTLIAQHPQFQGVTVNDSAVSWGVNQGVYTLLVFGSVTYTAETVNSYPTLVSNNAPGDD